MIVQLFIIFYGIPELGRYKLTNDAEKQWTLAPVNGCYYWFIIKCR